MPETEPLLLGVHGRLETAPAGEWRAQVKGARLHTESRLRFLTPDHQRVRYFAVSRLVSNHGRPLEPELIARQLNLPLPRVHALLDDLERGLFFLVRDRSGRVNWAFPVTVERTPHHLSFGSGERLFGAWAEDAVAAPFVEGRLLNRKLLVRIATSCAHCGRALDLDIDSELNFRVCQRDAQPLVFEPHIDWTRFRQPSIIHDYWANSLFFWSEEHAREFRAKRRQPDGVYLTLEQAAWSTRLEQSALFGFPD